MNSVSKIKIQNIYETHNEDVRQPKNVKYRNMQSTEIMMPFPTNEKHHYLKNDGKRIENLLKPEPKAEFSQKVVPVSKKPYGIKTFKHSTSGTRLGFAEVEVKPAPSRTGTNFWVDEGKSRSPVRNTKTWATSKEFSIGNHAPTIPQRTAGVAAAGSAGKKMFDFGKNVNSKNVTRPSTAVVDAPKLVPKIQIDMTPNSIVNVLSGDPFKKSYEARTQMRQQSVNQVRANFQTDVPRDKYILQNVEHQGLSII